jgi:hypothetical protein
MSKSVIVKNTMLPYSRSIQKMSDIIKCASCNGRRSKAELTDFARCYSLGR